MKTITRSFYYGAPGEAVFHTLDDLGVTGTHMTESSMMMMGSKLKLTYLTPGHTGPGTKYRWTGKMMGMTMDFTVEVTKWIHNKEKTWETIGEARLIIYSWYRMTLVVEPHHDGTTAILSISYERPKGFWEKILSFLFADLYCVWCLKKMLEDANKILMKHKSSTISLST